jgi:hypothetical protein
VTWENERGEVEVVVDDGMRKHYFLAAKWGVMVAGDVGPFQSILRRVRERIQAIEAPGEHPRWATTKEIIQSFHLGWPESIQETGNTSRPTFLAYGFEDFVPHVLVVKHPGIIAREDSGLLEFIGDGERLARPILNGTAVLSVTDALYMLCHAKVVAEKTTGKTVGKPTEISVLMEHGGYETFLTNKRCGQIRQAFIAKETKAKIISIIEDGLREKSLDAMLAATGGVPILTKDGVFHPSKKFNAPKKPKFPLEPKASAGAEFD